MELTIRLNLRDTQSTITGWEKRQTARPTSLILTTKFVGVFVLPSTLARRLCNPLNAVRLRNLEILDLTAKSFSTHLEADTMQETSIKNHPILPEEAWNVSFRVRNNPTFSSDWLWPTSPLPCRPSNRRSVPQSPMR